MDKLLEVKARKLATKLALKAILGHRVLVQMEGTAHIDFPKFETAKAINFKIIPLIHM